MDATPAIIQQLNETVAKLPLPKAVEVLDFARYLVSQESQHTETRDAAHTLDPALDPILSFIGGISHGSLAQNIDGDLYGE